MSEAHLLALWRELAPEERAAARVVALGQSPAAADGATLDGLSRRGVLVPSRPAARVRAVLRLNCSGAGSRNRTIPARVPKFSPFCPYFAPKVSRFSGKNRCTLLPLASNPTPANRAQPLVTAGAITRLIR